MHVQTLYDFVFQALPRKMTRPRNVMTLMIRQMTHGRLWASSLPEIVNAEEQQNVRQNADADVHEQIHERVCCKAAAQEGKNKVADQRCTAQNRHDEVQTVPRVAVEPVGKDEQRDEQQQD